MHGGRSIGDVGLVLRLLDGGGSSSNGGGILASNYMHNTAYKSVEHKDPQHSATDFDAKCVSTRMSNETRTSSF